MSKPNIIEAYDIISLVFEMVEPAQVYACWSGVDGRSRMTEAVDKMSVAMLRRCLRGENDSFFYAMRDEFDEG